MRIAALLQRSLSRVTGIIAGMSVLVIGLQVMVVLVARSQEESQSYQIISSLAPRFIQQQFGDALPAFLSFAGMATFAYFDPVILLMLAILAVFVACELSGDVEAGHVDLLLARAVPRHAIVTRSLVAMMLAPAAVALVMVVSGTVSMQVFAPTTAQWPSARTVADLAGHLVALAWCFGGAGLAVAAFSRRRLTATGIVAVTAVFLYLLEFLGNAWEPARRAALISPFHYTRGAAVFAGQGNSALDFAVLGSVMLAGTAIAYWRYNARDV